MNLPIKDKILELMKEIILKECELISYFKKEETQYQCLKEEKRNIN